MTSHTRVVLTLIFVLVVVFAGCSGGGSDAGGGAGGGVNASGGSAANPGGGGASAGGDSAGSGNAGAANQRALQTSRAIIRTGHVRLDIENFSTVRRNLTRATRRMGGYVGASRQTTRTTEGENVTAGRVVLRVPSRNFSALFSRVKATGTVRDARQNTTDVSGKVIDLRARLNNSRAQRGRLQGLYANASTTKATLKVQKRLSSVQSRIERLEGRLQALRGRIAYSTITVELAESAPEPDVEQWYDMGVPAAFLSSVGGVLTTIRAVVVALAYLGPYLLVFGVPIGAVGYVAYRRRGA